MVDVLSSAKGILLLPYGDRHVVVVVLSVDIMRRRLTQRYFTPSVPFLLFSIFSVVWLYLTEHLYLHCIIPKLAIFCLKSSWLRFSSIGTFSVNMDGNL